jgi:uncharacterized glyoxalase superfamily protein PhnB
VPSRAIPVLRITNSSVAEAFYCEKLGFHLDFSVPANEKQQDPCYMGVSRDEAIMHLSSHAGDGVTGCVVLILCHDVDAVYAEFVAKGVAIHLAPVNQTWGMRELYVRDPDGNSVRFAAPVERV